MSKKFSAGISFSSPEAALLLVSTKNRDLSSGPTVVQKGCCLSSKTREKNVCKGRMIELSTEMPSGEG